MKIKQNIKAENTTEQKQALNKTEDAKPQESAQQITDLYKQIRSNIENCASNCEPVAIIPKYVPLHAEMLGGLAAAHNVARGSMVFVGFSRLFCGELSIDQEVRILSKRNEESVVRARGLFVWMGQNLVPVQKVRAGCVFGFWDPDLKNYKNGCIVPRNGPFLISRADDQALIRVRLGANSLADMEKLVEGLRVLNRVDPVCEVFSDDKGEMILAVNGEIHLERCIHDLENDYSKVKIFVSEMIVNFKETVDHKTVTVKKFRKNAKNFDIDADNESFEEDAEKEGEENEKAEAEKQKEEESGKIVEGEKSEPQKIDENNVEEKTTEEKIKAEKAKKKAEAKPKKENSNGNEENKNENANENEKQNANENDEENEQSSDIDSEDVIENDEEVVCREIRDDKMEARRQPRKKKVKEEEREEDEERAVEYLDDSRYTYQGHEFVWRKLRAQAKDVSKRNKNLKLKKYDLLESVKEKKNFAVVQTPNKRLEIVVECVSLPAPLVDLLAENEAFLRETMLSGPSAASDPRVKAFFGRFLELLDAEGNLPLALLMKQHLQSFGPRLSGPNALVNLCLPPESGLLARLGLPSALSEQEAKKYRRLKREMGFSACLDPAAHAFLLSELANAFEVALLAGPLCEEEVRGCIFLVESLRVLGAAGGEPPADSASAKMSELKSQTSKAVVVNPIKEEEFEHEEENAEQKNEQENDEQKNDEKNNDENQQNDKKNDEQNNDKNEQSDAKNEKEKEDGQIQNESELRSQTNNNNNNTTTNNNNQQHAKVANGSGSLLPPGLPQRARNRRAHFLLRGAGQPPTAAHRKRSLPREFAGREPAPGPRPVRGLGLLHAAKPKPALRHHQEKKRPDRGHGIPSRSESRAGQGAAARPRVVRLLHGGAAGDLRSRDPPTALRRLGADRAESVFRGNADANRARRPRR